MNLVLLKGTICRDIDVRYSQGENPMAIARFSVACKKERKVAEGQPDADFINCIAFGKTAENIQKFFKKGSQILVKGSWLTGKYQNQNGTNIYTNECNVQSFEFCGSKNDNATTNNAVDTPAPAPQTFMEIPDGIELDLPFK